MKYIIHACLQRMWYVREYLIPSLQDQGITDISIWCDLLKVGCLESCMESFRSLRDDGSAWHLQDDVIICRDFKKLTEQYAEGIVCGFCYKKDYVNNVGYVSPSDMWWSFPCIHIPNKYARECADWYYSSVKYNRQYSKWVTAKKFDDAVFTEFMKIFYPEEKVLNLVPNLVDHVDYLIGGTTINQIRQEKQTRAAYFNDLDLVHDLETKLNKE